MLGIRPLSMVRRNTCPCLKMLLAADISNRGGRRRCANSSMVDFPLLTINLAKIAAACMPHKIEILIIKLGDFGGEIKAAPIKGRCKLCLERILTYRRFKENTWGDMYQNIILLRLIKRAHRGKIREEAETERSCD